MALGILDRRVSGLSGYVSTIPGECWDQPGFKDCQAQVYAAAKVTCQGQGQDNDTCIGQLADKLTMKGCKCVKKTTAKPVVVSSTKPISPGEDPFGPPAGTLFGMQPQTLLLVAAVAVGAVFFMGDSKKKGSS